jgi:hypothetical protein
MGLAAPLLTPYWVVQGLRTAIFSNLGQRLGFSFPTLSKLPENRPGAIWLHCSVGEAISGITLARRLKQAYRIAPRPLDSYFDRPGRHASTSFCRCDFYFLGLGVLCSPGFARRSAFDR